MTPAQFRKSVLALPGAVEQSHMRHPDFRVNGNIFAGLDEKETHASLKLSPEILATIDDPAIVRQNGAWGDRGWVKIALAAVDAALVKNLVNEAFTLMLEAAPKSRAKPKEMPTKKGSKKKSAATAPAKRRSPASRS